MAEAALEVHLEGTSQWDAVAGGADIYGVQDKIRAALATARQQQDAKRRAAIITAAPALYEALLEVERELDAVLAGTMTLDAEVLFETVSAALATARQQEE
jgi:hypothetical protein